MPCNDGNPDYNRYQIDLWQTATASLCGIVEVLDRQNFLNQILDAVDWKEAGVSRSEFEAWLQQHREQDKARKRREQAERDRQRLIKQAQSKLTQEELQALRGGGFR